MIATAHRDPLGAGHSYPVGADMLATRLGDLSAAGELELRFWRHSEPLGFNHPGWSQRRHQGYPSSLHEYAAVLAVHLRRDRHDLERTSSSSLRHESDPGCNPPGAHVAWVPLVREWLEAPRPLTWRHQRRYLQVGVNPGVTRLCVVESGHRQRQRQGGDRSDAPRGATIVGSRPVTPSGKAFPRKRVNKNPEWPTLPGGTSIAGNWLGELLIRPDGTVAKVWSLREPTLKPAFAPFNEAILQAVGQWEYEPWTVDGRAAPFCVTVAMSIDF